MNRPGNARTPVKENDSKRANTITGIVTLPTRVSYAVLDQSAAPEQL